MLIRQLSNDVLFRKRKMTLNCSASQDYDLDLWCLFSHLTTWNLGVDNDVNTSIK